LRSAGNAFTERLEIDEGFTGNERVEEDYQSSVIEQDADPGEGSSNFKYRPNPVNPNVSITVDDEGVDLTGDEIRESEWVQESYEQLKAANNQDATADTDAGWGGSSDADLERDETSIEMDNTALKTTAQTMSRNTGSQSAQTLTVEERQAAKQQAADDMVWE